MEEKITHVRRHESAGDTRRVLAVGLESIEWAKRHATDEDQLTTYNYSVDRIPIRRTAKGYNWIILDDILGVNADRLKVLCRRPGDRIDIISRGTISWSWERPVPEGYEIGLRGKK